MYPGLTMPTTLLFGELCNISPPLTTKFQEVLEHAGTLASDRGVYIYITKIICTFYLISSKSHATNLRLNGRQLNRDSLYNISRCEARQATQLKTPPYGYIDKLAIITKTIKKNLAGTSLGERHSKESIHRDRQTDPGVRQHRLGYCFQDQ